jgi:hypothetical protein
VKRGAGIEAARKRDADFLSNGKTLQDVGQLDAPKF